MKRFLLGALVTATAAFPTAAMEYTRFEMLPITPALRAGEVADCTEIAMLNVPPVWMPGDAAVVMLAALRVPNPARDRLVPALLFEHAAVLEIAPVPCARAEGRGAAVPANPVAAALGALAALRQIAGAGLVVVIGHGPDGRHALAAVEESEAAARLGLGGPRFAAAVALGEGPPIFVLGAQQPQSERAPERIGVLCEVRGAVAADLPEAMRSDPEFSVAACRAAIATDALPMPPRAAATLMSSRGANE